MRKYVVFFLIMLLITAPAAWSSGAKEVPEKDALEVILLIPGTLGDKSFFDSANQGIEMIRDQLGATTKVVEVGTDSTRWEPNLLDAAEGSWDIIISGNSMTEMMNAIAPQYPDKRFINFDTSIEETPDNVYSIFYLTNEAGFLAGAAAALITTSDMPYANEEPLIGFLGGMDIPGINDFLIGYIEGARHVNDEIQIISSYAGDFGDPAKGKELTLLQFRSGVDISYNVAGGTGLGLIEAAKLQDAYAIGVDADQAMLFATSDPEKAEHIVTSTVKKIDAALLFAVEQHVSGTLPYGTHAELGISTGAVGIAKSDYYQKLLPEEIKSQLEEIEQAVSSGAVTVSTAFGMSSDEFSKLRDSVSPY